MTKRTFLSIGLSALVGIAATGRAEAQGCLGDCNENGSVSITELVVGVNIGLGLTDISVCPQFDSRDPTGVVTVDELVEAVANSITECGKTPLPTRTPTPAATDTPTASPTPTSPPVCGDGVKDEAAGEECDDGNNLGGDGCAANCTLETSRITQLDPANSIAVVQSASFPVRIKLRGQQGYITGKARDTTVMDPQGNVVTKPGEIPVAVRASDVQFQPVIVTGLICACVRNIPVPQYAPGISSAGIISCNNDGLTDIDYNLVQDHDTNPGSPGNGGPSLGLPDDAQCTNEFVFPGSGNVSMACKEGTDPDCTDPPGTTTPRFVHIGICQSPRHITFFGGAAGRGSALINNTTAIGQLQDGGRCELGLSPDNCPFTDYGPDCIPCTDDDLDKGTVETLPTTTGTSTAAVYDANDDGTHMTISEGSGTDCQSNANCQNGEVCQRTCDAFGQVCAGDGDCNSGDTCRPKQCVNLCGGGSARCLATISGTKFDCDALMQNPTGGLTGAGLAVSFPTLDAKQTGDTVTQTILKLQ
jgi:cysteine-rich repeat protein